jgi:hypothetical protein
MLFYMPTSIQNYEPTLYTFYITNSKTGVGFRQIFRAENGFHGEKKNFG